jgi:hypothetical protein
VRVYRQGSQNQMKKNAVSDIFCRATVAGLRLINGGDLTENGSLFLL